jgi:chorismate mutase
MALRAIRGAIDVAEDRPEAVLDATRRLLFEMLKANPSLKSEDIASVIFTTTEDLTSAFPAQAAREMDWKTVPMLCCQELPVPGSLPRCVRVLLHWNTNLPQAAVHHVYLDGAAALRPDLSGMEAT